MLVGLIDNHAAAAEQARWLAELAQAIDRSQRLARTLAAAEPDSIEALELHGRLDAIGREVEALRRGSREILRRKIDPMWIGLLPWNRRREH